jgi:hypothetical protein
MEKILKTVIKKLELSYNSSVRWVGTHRDIRWEVSCHGFQEPEGSWTMRETWCTYVMLSEADHEKFKAKFDRAPWNGGTTYYRRCREEHMDAITPELAEKWNKPWYKIGDDFAHIWDLERADMYDLEYMTRHIQRVIDYLHDGKADE